MCPRTKSRAETRSYSQSRLRTDPLPSRELLPPRCTAELSCYLRAGFPLICIARVFWLICIEWAFLSVGYLSHIVRTNSWVSTVCLTSILNLPPGVCHIVPMGPRPPADTLECTCPEPESHMQIFRYNFFFFVSLGGLEMSIMAKKGFQGSSVPPCQLVLFIC